MHGVKYISALLWRTLRLLWAIYFIAGTWTASTHTISAVRLAIGVILLTWHVADSMLYDKLFVKPSPRKGLELPRE